MGKSTYKTTYKVYQNKRLKEVPFHGINTFPLYIQVTHRRKPIYFKSYYFDLFAHIKYHNSQPKVTGKSLLKRIETAELKVLKYLSDRFSSDDTLEEFKERYDFYATDLCALTEEDFQVFTFMFFKKHGYTALATTLFNSKSKISFYRLFKDLKLALTPSLYTSFIDELFSPRQIAAAYILLNDFSATYKSPALSLTAIDFEHPEIRSDFKQFVSKHFQTRDPEKMLGLIDKRIRLFKDDAH